MTHRWVLAGILLAGLYPTWVMAQGCCSVASPAVGILDQDPVSEGTAAIGLSHSLTETSAPYRGDESASDPLSRQTMLHRSTLQASIGISKRLSAGASLPWLDKSRDLKVRTSEGNNVASNFSASGFGDASFYGRFSFLPLNAISRREVSLSAGIKFPTGNYHQSQKGSRLELDLQPGTGSYAAVMGLSFYQNFKVISPLAVIGNASYQWQSENPDGYVIGQEFNYGAGAGWLGFLPKLDLFFQIKGRFGLEDNLKGAAVTGTGGHWIFAAPSLHVRYFSKLSAALSIAIPVYRNVNGLQVTPSYGLSAVLRYDITLWKKQGLIIPE